MAASLSLRFWGTRGLVSSPRPDTAIFGGNTPCVQILYKNHIIIVDSGFGAANLGEHLLKRIVSASEALTIHIFYTHFHWDHIQGLPFFHPIYFPSTRLNLYSPDAPGVIKENLDLLFDGSYSPFAGIASMPSQINFHQLTGPFNLDGLDVSYHAVDHGDTGREQTYAYRIAAQDAGSLCLVTDHEARPSGINTRLLRFAAGVDLLVHDGQYTSKEYQERKGWGHSTMRQALNNALKIGAKQCLLTHHDPRRTDAELKDLGGRLARFARYRSLAFDFAREDVIYAVAPSAVAKAS